MKRQGFTRKVRLTASSQFTRAFAENPVYVSTHFRCFAVSNDVGTARLGVVVGKRVCPQAVKRNRLKRTIREAFRQQRQQMPAVDLVVLVRRPFKPEQPQQLVRMLTTL